MTHNEVKASLMQVLQALNSIPVSGKTNLANLAGSIGVLEDILRSIPGEAPSGEEESE